MAPDDLQPGMMLTNAAHAGYPHTAVVTRVYRTWWRKRVSRFWLIWVGEESEAEHMPEDAAYLDPVESPSFRAGSSQLDPYTDPGQ